MMPPEKSRQTVRELLDASLNNADQSLRQTAAEYAPEPEVSEVGRVRSVSQGVVWVEGLDNVKNEELVYLGSDQAGQGCVGMALDLRKDRVGVILLSRNDALEAGQEAARSGSLLSIPVGDGLLGRVIDPLGAPLDGKGALAAENRLPVLRVAPPIMHRAGVNTPLQTGLKVIDAILPIGRGQRELILGDRQTGKTAIAVDAIINQRDSGVVCVYCSIGQRGSSVAKVRDQLIRENAMEHTVMVVVEAQSPPGLQYAAPYAATSVAEHFMAQGKDVLVVYDDLTKHAVAYRELSLLLRRPPGREAFPGDIFYIHSSLLERSTHLRDAYGGGSITALPIIETEAQNISAYIPTNLISITDGQIYLSPELFQKGILPAVDIGRSVSRVGGKAQLPSYQGLAGELRLSYAQFEELEAFARFGTRLDPATRKNLEHGKRIRAILKQEQESALSPEEQVFVLVAASRGVLDRIKEDCVCEGETLLREFLPEDLALRIRNPRLSKEEKAQLWDEIITLANEIISNIFRDRLTQE